MKTITLCLGTWNNADTLPAVLDAIKGQKFDKFLLFDNQSTDNSVALVQAAFPDVVVSTFPHLPSRMDNLCNLRLAMFAASDTDFTFTLDSDVVLPAGAIEDTLSYITPLIPMVGISYGKRGHVAMGAAMFITSIAKTFKITNRKAGCDCVVIARELNEQKLVSMIDPRLQANHISKSSAKRASGVAQRLQNGRLETIII